MSMQTTSTNADDAEPMMEMNTTPLIDVMLVLIIMLIITIPIQNHAVKLDLPQNSNNPQTVIDPVKNKIVITQAGQTLWNGAPVDPVQLRQYLDLTQQMNPTPELHLQPEAMASYDLVDQVLVLTKRAKVEKMGFVGNETYAKF